MSVRTSVTRAPESPGTAIVAPLIGRRTAAYVGFALMGVLLLMVFFVPADANECRAFCPQFAGLHEVAINVGLIDRMQLSSERPWTISISYFSALLMAVVGAALIVFARLQKLNWSALTEGGAKALIARLCAYAIWLSQFFITPGNLDYSRGSLIIHAIQQSRVALAVWVVLIYSASAFVLVAMLMELLARTSKGRDLHGNHGR